MGSAVEYCVEVGLSRELSDELKGTDIIGRYELFMRSALRKRHPATLTLKMAYVLSAVGFLKIIWVLRKPIRF